MSTAAERQRRRRQRLRIGARLHRCDVDIGNGLRVREVEIREDIEDCLVEAGLLKSWQCDFPELVDEAVRAYLVAMSRRDNAHRGPR